MATIFTDISTTMHLRFRAPCKFSRVERGLARCFERDGGRTVRFDISRGEFVAAELPDFDVNASFIEDVTDWNFSTERPNFSQRFALILFHLKSAGITALPLFRTPVKQSGLAHGLAWHLAQLFTFIPYERRLALARQIGIFSNYDLRTNFEWWLKERGYKTQFGWEEQRGFDPPKVEFTAGDVLVLAGASWCHIDFPALARLKQRGGLKIVGLIYDLLPIDNPALVTVDQRNRYIDYVRSMAKTCDVLITPSREIANAVIDFFGRNVATNTSRIVPISLCPGITISASTVPSARITELRLHERSFVLAVSSIRIRKGQLWAFGLWKKVWSRFGARAPVLIFAGEVPEPAASKCFFDEDLLWEAAVNLLRGPSDEELAWLYKNALFTLYPSIEGGLGMPIMEALSYGKYCLCGDAPSLKEAGQGITFNAGLDNAQWLREILRLIEEPEHLAAMNKLVAHAYRSRSWDDVAHEIERLLT
jgi:glycosyltransferase involved in cell wall biosynthesis